MTLATISDAFLYLGLQRRRDALVGVEREDPVAGRHRKAARDLWAVARPVGDDDARTCRLGDLHGLVAAARVEHEHLVGELRARDAVADARGFVLRDDDHGERIVLAHVAAGGRWTMSAAR